MTGLIDARGREIGDRAQLKPQNMKLSDGRMLLLRGAGPLGFGWLWTTANGLRVIASMDETPHGKLLHVSMSYPNRDPSWADIKAVREAFYADGVDAMMMLPKTRDYINIHEHTFHLWQTPIEWGVQ